MNKIFSEQSDWDELLDYISDKQVTPIIGKEMYKFKKDDLLIPIDQYLSGQILGSYQVMDQPDLSLSKAVDYLVIEKGKQKIDIISKLKLMVKEINFEFPLLAEFLGISNLNYFVNTAVYNNVLENNLVNARGVTPILIFDQFEEIFTLARKSSHFGTEELATFWEELADLIENSIPEKLKDKFLNDKEKIDYSYNTQKIKTVFAFREEFLPEFEHITAKIPSLKSSRFRLMPMNGNQAYDVITKTWKNNIDKNEADKIVGFFINEEDSNKSYELMEIEPSLLSQVCTYIDKERISEGQSKISSDFLERYPKEKILHSIYNEVLNESNAAVLGSTPDLTKDPKPVNEFLEDKLITDEGYRTKYSISEIDRSLLPGIEVLKRKYFVRDDGKSIEITHDVLAPIIKDDRETRRKAIAVAAARKRGYKWTFIIVFFALIGGGLFYYFTTKRAFADEGAAIARKDSIVKQITSDSTSLAGINVDIRNAKINLKRYKG